MKRLVTFTLLATVTLIGNIAPTKAELLYNKNLAIAVCLEFDAGKSGIEVFSAATTAIKEAAKGDEVLFYQLSTIAGNSVEYAIKYVCPQHYKSVMSELMPIYEEGVNQGLFPKTRRLQPFVESNQL